MALQDECRRILVTLCGRLADYYVARLVGLGLEAVALAELLKILYHALLVL